jgi:hypothetical protein
MTYINASGAIESRAALEVDAQFREGRWHQVNTTTPEGDVPRQSVVSAYFDADSVFRLDTDRIVGSGGEVCGAVVVTWSLRADPALTFAELITFHGDQARTRTWHHFRSSEFIGLTLLQEVRA